jgi:ATP-dependent Clp protease ATP-binding subunit ClpC
MNNFNLTPRAQRAILIAKETASTLNSSEVSLQHLIFSILDIQQFTILNFFEHFGVAAEDFKTFSFNSIEANFIEENDLKTKFSKSFKNLFHSANTLCKKVGHEYLGIEHLFYCLITSNKSPLKEYFDVFKINHNDAKKFMRSCLDSDLLSDESVTLKPKKNIIEKEDVGASKSFIEMYAKNYNSLALQGRFDKVFSSGKELANISEILCRRNKSNPILVGPPGTGKTSLIEALSESIVNGECTSFLSNKIVYELDLASLVAGTKYRGQFEERIKSLIQEVSASRNIILFIDEIHNIIGAGSAEGTMDAANILKPALARNDIKCIGATTPKEYRKYIQKDSALDRRFEKVEITAPSPSKTYEILNEIIDQYESFHNVTYRKNAIKLAIDLSVRYVQDRQLPDKAIDVIDQAGSRVKIKNFHKPKEAKILEKEIESLMVLEDKDPTFSDDLSKRQDDLLRKYKKTLKDWEKSYNKKKNFVTCADVYELMSGKTGIPIDVLSQNNSEILINLSKNLSSKVFGQAEACETLSNCIIRSRTGFSPENKPIGSFLFLGQTGVGKTYMAKNLSEIFFGSKDNLIHLDMSEYSEKVNVSRLIGSSPGYVGYDEGGQLTERIKQKPYSVVLFDEIEKAHPEVINILLQILDEGRLTDNAGRFADFRNAIIIMTGNIGAEKLTKGVSLGFMQKSKEEFCKDSVEKEVKKILSPELINRITEIIPFNSFPKSEILKYVKSYIKNFKSSCKSKYKINIIISEGAIDEICTEICDLNMGLRPLERIMQKKVENDLSKWIINNKTGTYKL